MSDREFKIINNVLIKYNENDTHVVVPEGVVEIGEAVFKNKNIEEIVLPSSLRKIGKEAFSSCINLNEINLPNSVERIEEGTFENCINIKRVEIPEGIEIISSRLFYSCVNLKEIILPDTIKVIEEYAFKDCHELINIVLPDGLEVIGYQAFCYCNKLRELHIPDSVHTIGKEAFKYAKSLYKINIPKNVKVIREGTFQSCKNLKSIVIPDTVEVIEERVFGNCVTLKDVYISKNIEYLPYDIFYNCKSLKNKMTLGYQNIKYQEDKKIETLIRKESIKEHELNLQELDTTIDMSDIFYNSNSLKDKKTLGYQNIKYPEDKKIETPIRKEPIKEHELNLQELDTTIDMTDITQIVEEQIFERPKSSNTYILFNLMDESTKQKWNDIQNTLGLLDFLQGVNYGFNIVPNKTRCVEIINNDDEMLMTLVHTGFIKMIKTYLDYKPSIRPYILDKSIDIYNKYKEYMDPIILEYLEEYKSNHFIETKKGLMSFEVLKNTATFIQYYGGDEEIIIPNKVGRYDVCCIDCKIDCTDNEIRQVCIYIQNINEIKRLFFEKDMFNNTKIFHVYISNDVKKIGGIMYEIMEAFKGLIEEGDLDVLQDNITIHASKDSVAYQYAIDNGLDVVEE